MNINTMKWIDCYVGQLVCLFLNGIYLFSRLLFGQKKVLSVKKILVMKFFGMGSIILATPFLQKIRRRYPEAKIYFLTFESNREILERLKLVDVIVTLRSGFLPLFIWDFITSLLFLRGQKCDLVFDLEFFARFSTSVAFLTGAPLRVGYYMNLIWRGNLLTHQVYYNSQKHISEVFMALLNSLGGEYEVESLTRPEILKKDRDNCEKAFLENKLDFNRDRVLINVNASDLSFERRWPRPYFVDLIDRLTRKFPQCDFILIGSPSEREFTELVQYDEKIHGRKNLFNLAGSVNLGGLLALMDNSLLLISNDSGPLHLSASLNKPTLALFGPESPLRYSPLGSQHTLFYKGIYCSPCLNVYNAKTAPCKGNNICMQKIEVSEVYLSAVLKIKGLIEKQRLREGSTGT